MKTDTITVLLIVVGVTFFSMILHELMHGLTAYWLGDTTAKDDGRLTLNPLAHIDPYLTILLPVMMVLANGAGMNMPIFGGAKPVPFNPRKVKGGDWGVALVALAGPLTNLVLAFICYVSLCFLANTQAGLLVTILYYGVMVNLGFFAFNMLPIPPLDGSRLLYAVAPDGIQRVMRSVERVGLIIIFVIVLAASPALGRLLTLIINGVLAVFQFLLTPLGL